MKVPTMSDQRRSLAIRCASKRGEYVSDNDSAWNRKIWAQYTEWYKSTESKVFQATKPFGSKD